MRTRVALSTALIVCSLCGCLYRKDKDELAHQAVAEFDAAVAADAMPAWKKQHEALSEQERFAALRLATAMRNHEFTVLLTDHDDATTDTERAAAWTRLQNAVETRAVIADPPAVLRAFAGRDREAGAARDRIDLIATKVGDVDDIPDFPEPHQGIPAYADANLRKHYVAYNQAVAGYDAAQATIDAAMTDADAVRIRFDLAHCTAAYRDARRTWVSAKKAYDAANREYAAAKKNGIERQVVEAGAKLERLLKSTNPAKVPDQVVSGADLGNALAAVQQQRDCLLAMLAQVRHSAEGKAKEPATLPERLGQSAPLIARALDTETPVLSRLLLIEQDIQAIEDELHARIEHMQNEIVLFEEKLELQAGESAHLKTVGAYLTRLRALSALSDDAAPTEVSQTLTALGVPPAEAVKPETLAQARAFATRHPLTTRSLAQVKFGRDTPPFVLTAVDHALQEYARSWVFGRGAQDAVQNRIAASEFAVLLDQEHSVLTRWQNLVQVTLKVIAAYHAGGIKADTIAELIAAGGISTAIVVH